MVCRSRPLPQRNGRLRGSFPPFSAVLSLSFARRGQTDPSIEARAARGSSDRWDRGRLPSLAQRERRETILRNGRGEIIQTQHPSDGVANRKRKVETRKRESRRRKRRRTLILYAKYRFSTILLWTFGLFKSRSICVRVRVLLAVCSSSSSSSEAKMRAVRSRSSIREFELVVVACPPPPSSPDLFFRPRRRKPAMIDSSLCSSRRRREEGEASIRIKRAGSAYMVFSLFTIIRRCCVASSSGLFSKGSFFGLRVS